MAAKELGNEARVYPLRLKDGQAGCEVQVSAYGLHLPDGRLVRWRQLEIVNLSRVPASRYNKAHFLCRIYLEGDALIFRADADQDADLQAYRAFLLDFHARAQRAEAKPAYTMGMRSRTGYITLISSFAAVFVLIEGLVAYAITQRGKLGLGIGFMIGVALVGYLFLRMSVAVLRPRSYEPDAIPEEVMPK